MESGGMTKQMDKVLVICFPVILYLNKINSYKHAALKFFFFIGRDQMLVVLSTKAYDADSCVFGRNRN